MKKYQRKYFIITIDGPAGCGKSSVGHKIAQYFQFKHVDSGALYRTYTWYALQEYQKINTSSKIKQENSISFKEFIKQQSSITYLKKIPIKIKFKDEAQIIITDNKNIQEDIRQEKISFHIKPIADHLEIRKLVNHQLQSLTKRYSIIADGRDMGTAVFTDANIKFFFIADVATRAKRRYQQLKTNQQLNSTLEEIKINLKKRDHEDQTRKVGALKKASSAITINTNRLSENQVVEQCCAIINRILLINYAKITS